MTLGLKMVPVLYSIVYGKHHLVDFFKYVQIMTLGHKMGTSRGHMFHRDPSREKQEKSFLSETTRARALIFRM